MGNGMNKVIPGLYVGNFRDAKNLEKLAENNITHILPIHDSTKTQLEGKIYHCVKASDSATQDLTPFFEECIHFIHRARLEGGSVLIHCLAGVSRSVTITAAYIMTVTSLGWRESIQAVRSARECANPNYGFQKQLQVYENEGVEQARQKLIQTFGVSPLPDDEDCRKLLTSIRLAPCQDDSLYPLPHRAYQTNDGVIAGPPGPNSSIDTL